MADLHKAIKAIHNNVVTINGSSKTDIVATDSSGNSITINWTSVESWTDPNEYQYKREQEYPLMQDQLDDIYHNGIDGWKKTIKTIKDKYPKE